MPQGLQQQMAQFAGMAMLAMSQMQRGMYRGRGRGRGRGYRGRGRGRFGEPPEKRQKCGQRLLVTRVEMTPQEKMGRSLDDIIASGAGPSTPTGKKAPVSHNKVWVRPKTSE
eukprot:NODE_2718_length_1005_cov_63.340547_g2698_i0.p3 GENE.NODE_2718_length_1005_cov_63.340547_g2698_i0~~NODE_2718_length_1005_cov_63.340547_g2698_i0.p3  ORF type:complete len:112 (-),score=11.89 NODE_2718_length_1005_cov_63.340547_g2698_i0:29-364(-)